MQQRNHENGSKSFWSSRTATDRKKGICQQMKDFFSIRDSKISFYNLSNHKRELDAPQISHVTFPTIRYDVHFGLWLSVEVRFKNCFFSFRTALLGWTLRDSIMAIAYLALVARARMYGRVSFSGLLMALARFFILFLPLCILRRETNNHPNHCESTRKPHR